MKKRWFALCMCIVMLAGILTSCGTNTGKIKFGAAGLGGTYRVFGDTFANLVTSKNKKYKMEVKTTAGSAANLRLLSDGYIQMAVAQTDLTNDAYERTGIFENEKQHGERQQEQSGGRRRNLNLSSLDGLSGLMTEEETLAAQMMRENGNSMDVTA